MPTNVKKKRRQPTDIETLEKQIRELKSTNRSLLKRLKKVDRSFRKTGSKEKDQESEYKEYNSIFLCPECHKGAIVVLPLGPRILNKCTVCDWHEIKKL